MNDTMTTEGEVSFDFGFDNFRPMGFTYTGVVVSAKIEKPKKETFTFTVTNKDGSTREVTKEAKPQLVVLIAPTDHETKSGNPYPEYLPLTHNSRSKLGIFIEHLKNLGISMGNDPSKLEGMEFQWEVKEFDFGGKEPTRVACAVAMVDALSGTKSTPAPSGTVATKTSSFDGIDIEAIAQALDGVSKSEALTTAMGVSRDPRVIAGMADNSLVEYLVEQGLISNGGGTYVSRVPAAV